ncbi:L-lactate permease [Paeniglutamicibacter psychrophenolicus]|uniref:L-lactate permease n=1 Tax=Paeniglutamicibacter psychrophenolicus TaxID=257454 RepID=UPI002783FED5|nr:L-lactate permease [Paeniglutamicibacter psychrophenolicus]MDQ0093369.1 lactate permease [Paeniglutamicibacter psychrophenolicus]
MDTFTPTTDPLSGSVALSAIVSLLPLVTFFVMLAVVKAKAHISGLTSLFVAILVAIFVFKMPTGMALMSGVMGAVFGAFPVVWIVIMAIWLYQVTVISGRFEDLRRVFDVIGGGDVRIQSILIAFCFGGLLEALAGFGAPVAITATMLLALGMAPLRAAAAVLVANTAPVAFGAVAIPITTAAGLTGLDANHIGAIVGHQAPLLAIFVPTLLLFILDGKRGVKEVWPAALVIGSSFAVAQFFCATYFSYELTDIVASLAGLGSAVVFLRFWSSKGRDEARARILVGEVAGSAGTNGTSAGKVSTYDATDRKLQPGPTFLALFPYLLVIVIFGIAKLWTLGANIPAALSSTDVKVKWPMLYGHILDGEGNPVSSTIYNFQWLSNPGTLLLFTGLIVAVVYSLNDAGGKYKVKVSDAVMEIGRTVYNMRWAATTILSVLALAYVMNLSGQTITIGTWLAGTGAFFAFLSPILGWIGTAVTGSDTSANALFAKLQQTAGINAGIDPNLLVAANTSGGVVGKLISPQNLAIAATAVGMEGKESVILKKVAGWSVGMLLILCVLVYLQSTPILSWMLPTP